MNEMAQVRNLADQGRESAGLLQDLQRFVLDPYIVRAVASVSAVEVAHAVWHLYPDVVEGESSAEVPYVEAWLKELRAKPGLALSTGRRNSDRGLYTCALPSCLGVEFPKGARVRNDLAWAILDSEIGRKNIGAAPELEVQRQNLAIRAQRLATPVQPAAPEPERGIRWSDAPRGSSVFQDGVLVCHIVNSVGTSTWTAKWHNHLLWDLGEHVSSRTKRQKKEFPEREEAKIAVNAALTSGLQVVGFKAETTSR